jgi:hypothetical protein
MDSLIPDPDPIRIQGFDDQKMKKKKITSQTKFLYSFGQKLQFTYLLASINDVKATKAFSHQKRTSRTSKHEIS